MRKLLTLAILTVMTFAFAVCANAAVGTIVYGYKTDAAPNLEEIDESWGEPSIYVDKNSPNTELHKYWTEEIDTSYYTHGGTGPNGRTTIEPEPSDFWMYVLYDRNSLYIGIKSPDTEPCGSPTVHRGDGARVWIQPLADMVDPYSGYGVDPQYTEYDSEYQYLEQFYHFYWNMSEDMNSVQKLFAGNRAEVATIKFIDGYMHAILQVSLADLGINRSVERNGLELGTAIMRCSSRSAYDEGYAGWLSWGKTLPEYTPLPTSVNTIILVDPDAEHPADQTEPVVTDSPETEPVVTDAPETEPVVTDAPETEPVVTDAPETEPVVTDAPDTEPVVTDAPETEPVVTDAPETEPVVTDAPETEPVVTDAPETEPVVTDAPETEPVVTDSPETEPVANNAEKKPNIILNVGIIIAVIVVGIIVVTLIKKKK